MKHAHSVALAMSLVLIWFVPTAMAYPSGAGDCRGGQDAVGNKHKSTATETKGTLSQGGFTVALDGTVLTPGATKGFTKGVNHVLTLRGRPGRSYRGVLIRLGGAGTSALSTSDANLTVAVVCIPTGSSGVTQKSNTPKTAAEATLRVNTARTNLPLDVTVVVEYNGRVSEHYYTRFILNAV